MVDLDQDQYFIITTILAIFVPQILQLLFIVSRLGRRRSGFPRVCPRISFWSLLLLTLAIRRCGALSLPFRRFIVGWDELYLICGRLFDAFCVIQDATNAVACWMRRNLLTEAVIPIGNSGSGSTLMTLEDRDG